MDLFDGKSTLGGAASRFRKDADGRVTFHPAVLGRGYIIRSEKTAARLRAGGVIFNLLCLFSIFMLHWDIIVWALVFFPGAWAFYALLNFLAVRKLITSDTQKPEAKPDIYLTVMVSGSALMSCLFGALYYFNSWPSLYTFLGLFAGEIVLVAIVVTVISFRARRGKSSPEGYSE